MKIDFPTTVNVDPALNELESSQRIALLDALVGNMSCNELSAWASTSEMAAHVFNALVDSQPKEK